MKKIKKLIAVMLLSLTLFNSIFFSYSMTVQAAEAIPISTALEAFLALFGLELGLGNQSNFFNNSEFTDFVTAVSNGETVSMPSYGEVNFSDGESILSFMTWASALSYTAADGDVLTLAKMLDSTSYKNSGTSATTAMEQQISAAVGDYNGSSEALAEDVQNTFTVINGGASNNGNNNMSPNRWNMFTAIMSTFLLGASKTFNEFVDSLSVPEETEFQDYDFDESGGFVPGGTYRKFSYMNDPSYSYYSDYYIIGSGSHEYAPIVQFLVAPGYSISNLFFVKESDTCVRLCNCKDVENFVTENIKYNLFILNDDGKYSHQNQGFFNPSVSGDFITCLLYVPLFYDMTAARAYFNDGDTSGLLNLVDTSVYPNFRKTAPTASATLSSTIDKWMNTNPAIDDISAAVNNILDASDAVAGTSDAVPAVNKAIAETTGVDIDEDSEADTDTSTGTSINYMGILGKILAAIIAIPSEVFGFFTNPIGTIIEDWQELLKWLNDFKLWIQSAYADAMAKLDAIGDSGNPNGPIDPDDDGSGKGTLNILNGFLLLIGIFFILLRIFLHLLEFIINVFRIPASPGFITGDFAIGFEYIKSVQLSPLSISVYDFLMGLVHILVLFSVVKVLKKHIDKIHI